MDADAYEDSPPEPLFRPVKKRKFLRRRADPDDDDPKLEAPAATGQTARAPQPSDTESTTLAADVGSVRRPHRPRRGGIEFSASSRQVGNEPQPAAEPPAEDLENDRLRAMCDRFTGHTGQSVDVDKHMMTYIESEMAKRYRRTPTDPPESDGSHASETAGGKPASDLPQREPASLGKLHEIDLGQETKLRNIARTEAATKRLVDDDDVPPGDEAAPAPPTKDEKPWRSRKRRNSGDMERDRLVEEVLRESKLDVYDEPEEGDRSDDQAADDKIAEQFRRDFLDAIQSRRRVARAKNTKPANKPEPPKGPKLGGSRSARAAMREMQEKSGQK